MDIPIKHIFTKFQLQFKTSRRSRSRETGDPAVVVTTQQGQAQDRADPRVGSCGSKAEEHLDQEGWPKMHLNLALRDEIQQMKGDRQMGKQ